MGRFGTRNDARNGLMDIVETILGIVDDVIGSEDPNVIDPSGYQRLLEDLNVDIIGVYIHIVLTDIRQCRSSSHGNSELRESSILPETNGFMA
jgi:hypothetical protein